MTFVSLKKYFIELLLAGIWNKYPFTQSLLNIFYPLAVQAEGVLLFPESVRPSVYLSVPKLYFVLMITPNKSEL